MHGAQCTSGEHASKFKNPWNQEDFSVVELHYPSKTPTERFELKWPKNEKDDYKPMEDIIETCKHIALHYFPDELSARCTSEEHGFGRMFNKSWQRQNVEEFVGIVVPPARYAAFS